MTDPAGNPAPGGPGTRRSRARNPAFVQHRLRAVFGLLALILALLVAGVLVVARDLNRSATDRFVKQLIPQRAASRDILLQLLNEETAVRGFVITGQRSSLEPFAPAKTAAAHDLETLQGFAASDAELRSLVERATLERTDLDRYFAGEIALVRTGRAGQARAAAGIEAGKTIFDGFRTTALGLFGLASAQTTEAEARQNRYYSRLVTLIAVAGGIALLIVGLLGWLVPQRTVRLVRAQQRDAAAAERARALAEALQLLTSELTAAEDVSGVRTALAGTGRSVLDADAVSLGTPTPDGSALAIWGSGEAAEEAGTLALDSGAPEAAVVREGAARYLRTPEELAGSGFAQGSPAAIAIVPLREAGGAGARGHLAAHFAREQDFGPPQRALLRTVAALVGQALTRAESRERDRHTASVLQRALLPAALPSMDGVLIRGRYEAGGVGAEVGGDWYEAIELPDGTIAASVGDVAGKGVLAAALMGRLRHSYRAYALEGHTPAAVLGRLTRHIRQDDMATVLAFDIDLENRTMRYSCAGHLPAILLDLERARTTLLDTADAPPLGIAAAEQFTDTTVGLPERGLVFAYTDGLVERREANLADRIEILRRLLLDTPADSLDSLIDLVTESMRGDQLHPDDLAILAVAFGQAPTSDAEPTPGP